MAQIQNLTTDRPLVYGRVFINPGETKVLSTSEEQEMKYFISTLNQNQTDGLISHDFPANFGDDVVTVFYPPNKTKQEVKTLDVLGTSPAQGATVRYPVLGTEGAQYYLGSNVYIIGTDGTLYYPNDSLLSSRTYNVELDTSVNPPEAVVTMGGSTGAEINEQPIRIGILYKANV